jgi:hypothetical protein
VVRWSDGFYGGLLAAVISAIFYAIVSAVTRGSVGVFYADIARALPPLRGTADGAATIIVGAIVYLIVAILFGIIYALLAGRIDSMLHAPTSVLWGIFYGLLTWWVLANVAVPVLGAANLLPAWESIVGCILFYGLVLSEYTTIAYRRVLAEAAAGR